MLWTIERAPTGIKLIVERIFLLSFYLHHSSFAHLDVSVRRSTAVDLTTFWGKLDYTKRKQQWKCDVGKNLKNLGQPFFYFNFLFKLATVAPVVPGAPHSASFPLISFASSFFDVVISSTYFVHSVKLSFGLLLRDSQSKQRNNSRNTKWPLLQIALYFGH